VTKGQVAGFIVGFSAFLVLLLRSEPGFVPGLDHANLLFHEAGHPIIGVFSTRLEPYGGTIGQLAFPVILAVSFWRKGQALGTAACSIWFFENWFNIARYVADARSMALPLVGGGNHDWNTILFRWGALQSDAQIAEALTLLAWVGIGVACAWFALRVWRSGTFERRTHSNISFDHVEDVWHR
jgi:hypothetical protein